MNMKQKSFKFGTHENIKFLEIYRNCECLWDPQNTEYKNRDARDAALKLFAVEMAMENFGPKQIMAKIKNMRSQYLQEVKKIKRSMGSDAGTGDIYSPQLPWFTLMDSILKKVSESRGPISDLTGDEQDTKNYVSGIYAQGLSPRSERNISSEETQEFNLSDRISRKRKVPSSVVKNAKQDDSYVTPAIDKLNSIEKRALMPDDDLTAFGKYVVSSLRKLNNRFCIFAQDEIQSTLSKYRLRQLTDLEAGSSTSSVSSMGHS